eukprot:TRINITY_DN44625_c0_g1_i1.p1 TRINITY_DN44625_c0_g1~~TRINITY_DN44625_c0_g1_i1.p1  ORF type:complete len:138 (+),score=7.21 TRINITY_DN44625_c0_g1_i1:102-515(+)
MPCHSLWIISKTGGLIYQKNFGHALPHASVNDLLTSASTFHTIFAISAQISPVPDSSGIQMLQTSTFRLWCFETVTKIKFLLVTDVHASQQAVDAAFRDIYTLFTDVVLKSPFCSPDQPIRSTLWDAELAALISRYG